MRVKDERAFPRFDCPLPDASPTTGGCVMAEAAQKTPVKSEEKGIERAPAEWSPLTNLRREFDRMLEDFPLGLAPTGWAG